MIPVNEPDLSGREKELLIQCIDSGWISSDGPFVKDFEDKFSNYIGCEYGIAVANGTAALETALYAANVGIGDEVIIPSFTIISCAIAVIRLGAKPVFVDVDPDTWCIDIAKVEEKITPHTKAVMAVHMFGHPVDMDPLISLKNKYGFLIVEDAAQVHGAEYKGRKCGSLGDVASFSFYANKIITTGEGGMVTTSDPVMGERARSYKNLCFDTERRYIHEDLGYNFRMTNMQAAIGLAQLERIDYFVSKKREMGDLYVKGLSKIPGLQTQIEKSWAFAVYWMYCLVLDEKMGISAEELSKDLKLKGIGTRLFFTGMHQQPSLINRGICCSKDVYPVTEKLTKQGLYLPSGMTLKNEQINYVLEEVLNSIKRLS